MQEELKCSDCGTNTFLVVRKKFNNGTKHVEAFCSVCHKHLQWLPAFMRDEEGLTNVAEIEVPFGKHKGMKLKDIPRDYLQWMAENGNSPKWKALSAEELQRRGGEDKS